MGGKEAFRNNLETMYNTPLAEAKYVFYAQLPDHTGNVGQFSMANEPSMPYSLSVQLYRRALENSKKSKDIAR